MDKVNNLQSDLDALEEALGQEHIEMYLRQLKMELRCARSLADEQVKIILSKINVIFKYYSPGENYSHQHQRTNGNGQSKLFCPET